MADIAFPGWKPTRWMSSAPGKIILFGEHAVVHGMTSVAASIDLRASATVEFAPENSGAIGANQGSLVLNIPDFNLHCSWLIDDIIKAFAPVTEGELAPSAHQVEACPEKLLGNLLSLVEAQTASTAATSLAAGVAAVLYIYIRILGRRAAQVSVSTELPVGAGLGSSAAFCVALSGAFLAAAGAIQPAGAKGSPFIGDWGPLTERSLELINAWAFQGERIIHGRPSGVDNNVSTYGHMVSFRQGVMMRLDNAPQLRLLLTNTCVPRNTKWLVTSVGQRALRHPQAFKAMFESIDEISKECVSLLQGAASPDHISALSEDMANAADRMDVGVADQRLSPGNGFPEEGASGAHKKGDAKREVGVQVHEMLAELVQMNQGLLRALGVSHPAIEEVCQATTSHGLHSKLTGAGGGGCVLTLLSPGSTPDELARLKGVLQAKGMECFEASVGGNGVCISVT